MIKKMLLIALSVYLVIINATAQEDPCSIMKSGTKFFLPEASPESVQEVLMNKYDVKFHHLNLNVETTNTFISGWVRTIALVKSDFDTFAFELHSNLILDSVYSGTQKLITSHFGNFAFARSVTPFTSGNLVDVKIYYHGFPPTSGAAAIGSGFSNKMDGASGLWYTYSLSQPYCAEEWWPCKQSLKDKIDSVYVFVTTDSVNKVGSNGTLKNKVIVGNKKRHEWKQIYPIDYYLISVAVGKYYDHSFYVNPVNTPTLLIQNYIYDNPATISQLKPKFDSTGAIIQLFCKLFGPYVFAADKYGHSMAPVSGGMEHQTMTTIGIINFSIIAHELAHQWFGDAVTCDTWSDIWVNEGFATYCAYMAQQYLDTAASITAMNGSHSTVMSQPDGSVWFTDTTNVSRIFSNRLTYQKGASIIHLIRFELNDDTVFFNVMKEYIKRFKGGTGSALDFKKVLEEVSGKDFTQFFKQWFYGEGYPTFNVFWNQVGTRLNIINAQVTSWPSSITLFETPLEYKIKTVKGDTIIRVMLQNNVVKTLVTIVDSVLSVEVDPRNWLFCKKVVIRDPDQIAEGIKDVPSNDLQIVVNPNPATNTVTVAMKTTKEKQLCIITDATGREIFKDYLFGNTSSIDIHNWPKGVYFMTLGSANTQRFKIVKL